MPQLLAAIWARRSDTLSSIFREHERISRSRLSSKTPPSTTLNEMMAMPSSASEREFGGMLPGEMPPTSAWWPLDATKKTSSPSSKTGVMAVMSGRCEPPASCG